MELYLDNSKVDISSVSYNDGLNFNRFYSSDKILHYKLCVSKHEFIKLMGSSYNSTLAEIKLDDELTGENSAFKKIGYINLTEAFNSPQHLSEIISIFLSLDFLDKVCSNTLNQKAIINSVDNVKIEFSNIIIEGRCRENAAI